MLLHTRSACMSSAKMYMYVCIHVIDVVCHFVQICYYISCSILHLRTCPVWTALKRQHLILTSDSSAGFGTDLIFVSVVLVFWRLQSRLYLILASAVFTGQQQISWPQSLISVQLHLFFPLTLKHPANAVKIAGVVIAVHMFCLRSHAMQTRPWRSRVCFFSLGVIMRTIKL